MTTPTVDEVRALAVARNAADAALCERSAAMDETRAHEAEGAPSIGTWARRELGQDAGLTRQMVRAASTLRDLPAVGEAAREGSVAFEHVTSFTYALRHIGVEETPTWTTWSAYVGYATASSTPADWTSPEHHQWPGPLTAADLTLGRV